MSLQEYTTEELKAELKRRSDIEKAEKRKNRDYKAKYLYATGIVDNISNGRFYVRLNKKYIKEYEIPNHKVYTYYKVDKNKLKRIADLPKIGDIVRLRCRITKTSPKWNFFNRPFIEALIEREK